MAAIPLSWNDPMFSGVTSSNAVTLKNGATLSDKSITDTGNIASVVGQGSFTVDQVRIDSREGVRLGGDGNIVINNSYIETTGTGADHADGIQAYSPGSSGNLTITNTSIVSHNSAANAGLFIADNYGGSVTLNNVVFQGGPTGLKIYADDQPITVALKDVYFVGPFMFDPLVIEEIRSDIHITQWDNVRYATIVNGELVPGALIKAPLPVEGGTTAPTPAPSPAPAPTPGTTLAAPHIDSYSTDSGKVGDGITNDNTLTLTGSAPVNTTVNVFDGASKVGTVQVNSSGQWSVTTSALSDGFHKLTATDTNSVGKTSAASEAISVTIDTHAPTAPKMGIYSTSGAAVSGTTANNDFILKGTAEASSTVKVFDGGNQIGTATTNSSGAWSFEATDLANGGHNFTSKAMDAAGNTSSASAASGITVSAPAPTTAPTTVPKTASIDFTNLYEGWNDTATIKGMANPYTQIKLLDGTQSLGSVKAGSDGSWSFKTSALSDTVHTLSAQQIDSTGRVVATSPDKAILGTTRSDTLTSTTGDDLLVGNGGSDTFVFANNFGNDTIKDFEAEYAVGWRHDTIQFSKSVFDDFASMISHASQVGQDVVISTGSNSLTLKNATLSGLDHYDFHFA